MFDLSMPMLLTRIGAFLVIIAIHGFAIAGIARLLGDRGPAYDGRLTANPFLHLDMLGLVSAIAAQTGWIKTIDLERGPTGWTRFRPALIAVLALCTTLALGVLAMHLRTPSLAVFPSQVTDYLVPLLARTGEMSVWFVVFNLLILPPLTGGYVLLSLAPAFYGTLVKYRLWIGLALAAIFVLTRGVWLQPVVVPVLNAIIR